MSDKNEKTQENYLAWEKASIANSNSLRNFLLATVKPESKEEQKLRELPVSNLSPIAQEIKKRSQS
jgi:hypothetical protein